MGRHRLGWALFLAAALVNALLLWHFFDRYWYPSDEGIFAHIAERLLNGEILNAQIQNPRPGYGDFVNAAAFRLFGVDLVSLRYPLVAVAFVQASLVYLLLWRRDALAAALGSIAITALGVIQFLDPSAHWYCLFLCVLLVCVMIWLPITHPGRLLVAGVLIGTVTLFRQLSGVFVAMAVLAVALQERSVNARGRSAWFGRTLVLIMLTLLAAYFALSREAEIGGFLFIALWPMAILAWMFINLRTTNGQAAAVFGQLAGGAAIAATPLLSYHLLHHSLAASIRDTIFDAWGVTQLGFLGHGWYGVLPIVGLYQVISTYDLTKILNGAYWAALPLIPLVNGLLVMSRLRRGDGMSELTLPIVAAFYAPVSLHREGPVYIYFVAGLCLVALLWMSATAKRWRRFGVLATAALLSIVAVLFHAGQSSARTPLETLEGLRISTRPTVAGWSRGSLRLDPADVDTYGRLIDRITREVPSGESIFALPNESELYFLANRRNPFRFCNSATGIRSRDDLSYVMGTLTREPPRMVAFRPEDKWNTDASRTIMTYVRSQYDLIDSVGGVELYRRHF